MGMKRGVSLYSYQQAEWSGKMTWRDQLEEVATNLGGATGIEIISEATIPQYPFPSEQFIFDWNNEIARWGLTAVTMDCYLDVMQFRTHVMNHAEAAQRLMYDLRLAKRMGFKNIRLVHSVPLEAIEMALPLAEELDVRMTNEIHAPYPITANLDLPDHPRGFMGLDWKYRHAQDVAFIEKTGTKHYGLQPDMGIFQYRPPKAMLGYMLRQYMNAKEAAGVCDEYYRISDTSGEKDAQEYMERICPQIMESQYAFMLFGGMCAQPEELFRIAPYIYCIHGKFYGMSEIPGQPGHYEEASIRYPEAIKVLKSIGYEGYIDSEYEGQRSQQDTGDAGLADEVEEVRRHHEMLKRLIGE